MLLLSTTATAFMEHSKVKKLRGTTLALERHEKFLFGPSGF